MNPQRPERQVRRSGLRPTYGYNRRSARPPRQLPSIRISGEWLRRGIVGVIALFLLVMVAQATRLQKITVVGLKSLDQAHVQRVSEEGTHKQWFGRNALIINTGALADYLEKAEPGIKQAKISHKGLNAIQITVTERQPSLNWKSNNILYLLDADGTVVGQSKGSYVRLPAVTDSTNLPVKLGDRVAPEAFVTFCAYVWRTLPTTGLNPVEMTVPETTSEISVKTDKGFMLKLDTTRSAADELADLQAVEKELAQAKKLPTQYIDLRIPHKAYYK